MLNRRQFEIYMRIVETAAGQKDIAREFGIKEGTAKGVVNRICRKMGVRTPLQLLVQYHRREACR